MRALRRGDPGRASDAKPYAVLDIETDGLRGALVYWTATCECAPEHVETGRSAASLWAWINGGNGSREHRGRDHVWWAHNGGEYDYLYLFDPIRRDALAGEIDASPVVRAGSMIGWRITASKHRVDLRDSFALLPSSLRSLADQLAPELPKGDIGLADGVRFDPDDATHRAYAERDARALLAVLTRYRALLADRFDGTLPSWSAASTALRAWQRTLADDEWYGRPPGAAAALARAGYYGGMVHLGSVAWHGPCLTLDINSMYPATMRDGGVPDGWCVRTRRFVADRPGFYVVTVTVPDDEPFTFLPYRDGAGQLAWPTGTFRTVVSSMELARAIDRGYRVQIEWGYVWRRLAHPFASFVGKVETMRAEGGALAVVGKIAGNSLYGKFGSKPTRDDWIVAADRPGPEWWPPAGDDDTDGLWTRRDVPLRAPYLMPHWAAWITAGARMRLCALVDAIGPEHVIYTDTDSVTAPAAVVEAAIAAGRVTIGRAFGEAKIEHRYDRFRALAPKVTQGIEGGDPVYRAKGIPRRHMAAAFDTGTVAWDSPNAGLLVLRGAPMTTARHRRLSSIDGSVAWRARPDGTVRPVRLGLDDGDGRGVG